MGRQFPTTRRQILKGGGALIIGFSLAGRIDAAAAQGSRIGKPLLLTEVDSFLAIDDKSNCTVYSGKVDLGTGTDTALRRSSPRNWTCRSRGWPWSPATPR